jgi:hypothetical protein
MDAKVSHRPCPCPFVHISGKPVQHLGRVLF